MTPSDTEWTRIRPEITRIVDVARTSKARKDHQNRLSESEASRKNSLRSYYNELLEDLDDGQYPPLFEEFLELSSVRPLWTREDVEDLREVVEETKWLNALEAVQAEFEDYHVALIEEAIRLILKTNEGYTEAEEADLEEAVAATMAGDLDAFFNKASSAVFCDLGCETEVSLSVGFNFMLGYRSDREKKVKKASFFGTFPEVVAHQLSHHNSHKATPSKPERGKTPPTGSFSHFSLPLEVASVVGDLVDLFETSHPIDLRHLDLLSKGYLKCKDLPGQSWFPDWKSLVSLPRALLTLDKLTLSPRLRSIESTSSLARTQERNLPSTSNLPSSFSARHPTGYARALQPSSWAEVESSKTNRWIQTMTSASNGPPLGRDEWRKELEALETNEGTRKEKRTDEE